MSSLTRNETWSLLTLVAACVAVVLNTFQGDGEPLVASLALSGVAFAASFSMIRWLESVFMQAGLKGKDMGNLRRPEMYSIHLKAQYIKIST